MFYVSVVEYQRISMCSIPDPLPNNAKCEDHKGYYTVPVFRLCGILVTTLLLLSAKDVETVQRQPGMYILW